MWWKKKEKDPEEYEEEWDDSVVERKRIDINKEEDRERYLRTCCEQIADASREMENLTYDRLHTNGVKSLYPTFVNLGKQESLNGSEDLFILKLKAKRKVKFELTLKDGILVDKELRMHQF